MNFKALTKKQWIYLVTSCLCVVFGILFCIFSMELVEKLRTFICLAVMACGVFYLLSYCIISFDNRDTSTLLKAFIALAFGLLVIFIPSFFIMAIAGVIALLGLSRVLTYRKTKKLGEILPKDGLIIGIAELSLSVVLMVISNIPPLPDLLITIYLGVMLILEGILGIITIIAMQKTQAVIKETIENKLEENSSKNDK